MNTNRLAQINVARLREPIDSELLADFVAALDPVNALADGSPGFVWRLQTEDGDATSIRVFDDDMVIVNMSVWASLEDLKAFVYRGDHAQVMRNRKKWFHQMRETYVALWWIPEGHIPTVEEAVQRLEHLRANGPSAWAFTFKSHFPPLQGEPAL
jgi:hypothetical protein